VPFFFWTNGLKWKRRLQMCRLCTPQGEDWAFRCWQGRKAFLLSNMSSPSLGRIQSSFEWVQWAFAPGVKDIENVTLLPQRLNLILPVFWVITRREVVWNRCFGNTYRYHIEGWRYRPLKMGPIGGPEMSVSNHLTPRTNPEDGRIRYVCLLPKIRMCGVDLCSSTCLHYVCKQPRTTLLCDATHCWATHRPF
jgi:hypothetical protein